MKSTNYTYILFLIALTVLATIGLQIFWNIKNYNENKIQLIKEVQTAFDNSIAYYYVEDSKNDYLAIYSSDNSISNKEFIDNLLLDSVFKNNRIGTKPKIPSKSKKNKKSIAQNDIVSTHIESIEYTESPEKIKEQKKPAKPFDVKKRVHKDRILNVNSISSIKVLKGKKATDSISKLKNLMNKVFVYAVQDSIEFKKLSKALNKELLRKNIDISYSLQHFKADTLFATFAKKTTELSLSAISSNTYLPKNQKLQIFFSDPTKLILKRSLTEIILSLLLSLSVLFCLLYLLKTIQKQKKIDVIKNDLISNITHEFKTPITTISTAIEGIKNFNTLDDVEKTNRYLNISQQQLKKLEIMVEKLLETASLNTDQLKLNKEETNIVELVQGIIDKHQMSSDKKVFYNPHSANILCAIDVFHFENAVSNLIDNAIKYGGSHINISLTQIDQKIKIAVEDNGLSIEKTQREKIFEQFYRIPKGNIHDVKGFGIGLYYAKKIIEKHGGSLQLDPNLSKTIFNIILPNVH